MKSIIFIFILYSATFADINTQIVAAQTAQQDAAALVQKLISQKTAMHTDSLYQADPVLKAAGVKVVGSADDTWSKVVIPTDPDKAKAIIGELKYADIKFSEIASDTLYMRQDWAEKALPVISAALKE